jgi:DNA-directed RNA polymerase subunit N (RpoN/RPB10)
MNCFNCGKKIAEDNAEDAKLFADTGMCKECYEKAMVEMHAAKDPIPVIVIGLVGVLKELLAGVNGISDALRDRNSLHKEKQ